MSKTPRSSQMADDFWDLESLLPKRIKPRVAPFSPNAAPRPYTIGVKPVDAQTEDSHQAGKAGERRLTYAPTTDASTRIDAYTAMWNPFLGEVRVIYRDTGYNFYRQFLDEARRLQNVTGTPCRYVPFFSYTPQYRQMDENQMNYYLFWRNSLRKGEFPKTDRCYYQLYVSELVNLATERGTETTLSELLSLWNGYAEVLPQMDTYMQSWVMDFCLAHHLPFPLDRVRRFSHTILEKADLKEFFLGSLTHVGRESVGSILSLLSDYQWRDSRYAKEEATAPLYEAHMDASLFETLDAMFRSGELSLKGTDEHTFSHPAFLGLLYAQSSKIRLEVTYHPFSENRTLRTVITSAVRYSENKLRARLGLKSRLSIAEPVEKYCQMIDAYYRITFRAEDEARRRAALPAYEALYDAPEHTDHSLTAAEIERISWQNTRLLVTDQEEEASTEALTASGEKAVIENHEQNGEIEQGRERSSASLTDGSTENGPCLSSFACAYLRAALIGRAEMKKAVQESGKSEDTLAEEINEAALQRIGDVVLSADFDGDGYRLLDDYMEEVHAWMSE